MSFAITNYTPTDYQDVWSLHQKTISENDGFVKNLSFHTDLHDIQNIYKAFFVMRDDRQIVGMVGLKQLAPDVLEIKRLQIAANYQGMGLSKKLIAHVLDYARNTNASFLRLDVSEPQTKARNLYLSMGFTVTHTEHRSLGPDNEKFFSTYMEKKI